MSYLKNFMTKNSKKIVTHNGSFHADDIFSCATITLMLEKKGETFEIFRTRDKDIIEAGDYVFDVGGYHDADKNRFDHHQKGGAGKRENNSIEYAAFGLVWKKFGIEICETQDIVDFLDQRLVSPVDAGDNGFDLVENKYEVSPYYIQHFFNAMRPTWLEKAENKDITDDEMFLKCVEIAKVILGREIIQAKDALLAEKKVIALYNSAPDKRIIVLDKDYSYENILNSFPEPLYVIYERVSDKLWGARAVRKDTKTFKNRKDFPASWAGLKDEELEKVTGVEGATFCHKGLFLVVAKTKEAAIKLAQIAVE
ncbi:MAG: MYG1 family protein [Candidatus Paceibacterota bacterium]|jgi:uncharacterized UPF0160 family protein